MSEKIWYKVAQNFVNAGRLPIRITDNLIEIFKVILTEDQAKFLLTFKKSSYNIDEFETDLDKESLIKMLNSLMQAGAISGIPSRRTGVMVYRILPLLPGILETTFMKGETGEKDKRLAVLFQNFFDELVQSTQANYDLLASAFKNVPSIARIVPVEEEIDPKQEVVIPFEELSKIIEKQDTIGLATCYCRHRKDLLDDSCKKTDERQNCFSFGRTAEFLISQGFMNPISVEQAMEILKKAEDDGLVHKAFHNNLDPEREIEGMCNCCKCCCGTFEMYHSGASPLNDLTSYLAEVDADSCVSCGTCVENCNTEAIELIDTVAVINEEKCIGCGVCAHLCPENSISLKRTGPRNVFVLPPKLAQTQ